MYNDIDSMIGNKQLARALLVARIFVIWFLIIALRLVYLQMWEPMHTARMANSELRLKPERSGMHVGQYANPLPQPALPHAALPPSIPPQQSKVAYGLASKLHHLVEWLRRDPAAAPLFGLYTGVALTLASSLLFPGVRFLILRSWDRMVLLSAEKRAERAYLNWVVRQHRWLPLLPSSLLSEAVGKNFQELESLYVGLSIESREGRANLTVQEALSRWNRIVLLGDPGSGKTTTLRFLALTIARAILGRSPSQTPSEATAEKVVAKRAQGWIQTMFSKRRPPIPIYFALHGLRNRLTNSSEASLSQIILDDIRKVDGLSGIPEKYFSEKTKRGECLFLLDGFDEISSAAARAEAARKISDLGNSIPSDNLIVVTSRHAAYGGELGSSGFTVLNIEALSSASIDVLVTKWHAALGTPEKTADLLAALRAQPRISDLAVNPMLLSLIVLVQHARGIIPDRRHILYRECITILLQRKYSPYALQEEYNSNLTAEDAGLILQKVAFRLHSNRLKELPRSTLERAWIPEALRELPLMRDRILEAKSIVDNIEKRSQLLLESRIDEDKGPFVSFLHLTLQEYLVSRELIDLSRADWGAAIYNEVLKLYWSDCPWWEEVLLLFVAQLDKSGQDEFWTVLLPNDNNRIT